MAALKLQPPQAEIRIVVVEAISSSLSVIETALIAVRDLNIRILINNVGGLPVMSSYFKTLAQYAPQEIDDTVYLNNRFMARITRLLLLDLSRNGPSLITNISSGGQIGLPYQVMYSATKGFVSSFSVALSTEAVAEGLQIEAIAIVPGHVRSRVNKMSLSWSTPSSQTFARAALRMAGCGQLVVPGYWRHALQILLLQSLPTWIRQQALVSELEKSKAFNEKEK
jgi:17beta-estradiol 17-dehydrogenase / very-long-chain 3-oxoacyl-CoA reductase